MRRRLPGLLVLLALLTSGCASLFNLPERLPERLEGKGLLVAHVSAVGLRVRQFPDWSDPLIDGRARKGGLKNGYITVALPPGEHTFGGLYQSLGSSSSSFNGVTVTRHSSRTLPIKRTFIITAGQVTNLGLIVLVSDDRDPKGKDFSTFFVDNTPDMRRFLRRTYPTLAASTNLDAMALAPGGYVPAEKLDLLRRALIGQGAHTWPNLDWLARDEGTPRGRGPVYLAGPVGILAEMARQPSGRLELLRLLPLDTMSDVVNGWWDPATGRYAFVTADRRLFMVRGGQVTERALPTQVRRPRVYLPGERTVVAIDDEFEIWTSLDDGASWRQFVHDRGLNVANWAPGVMGGRPRDAFAARVTPGRNGYYVYATVGKRAAFFSRYGTGVYEPVALPEDIQVDGVEERGDGLYVWAAVTYWTSKSRAPLFVRAPGATDWERRELPGPQCRLRFLDEPAARILGTCITGRFESSDGGRSWRSL